MTRAATVTAAHYPPGDQSWYQWPFFNGGKYNPGYPDEDQYEMASTNAGYNNGKAQVACYSDKTPTMDVYRIPSQQRGPRPAINGAMVLSQRFQIHPTRCKRHL